MKSRILILLFLVAAAGCQNGKKDGLQGEIAKLKINNATLTEQLAQSQKENEQLKQQVQALRNFGTSFNYSDIYNLQKINITKFTNIYDSDGDGKKETLVVYFQPMDEYGDIIKATGLVEVQLWDLNMKAERALLGQWKITPADLKKVWFATLITINYRLSFNISGIVEKFEKPLTLKIKFTDYLSGKTFEEQRVINPQ